MILPSFELAFDCFTGFLRRPTDILRMQLIFHFSVETLTPPIFLYFYYISFTFFLKEEKKIRKWDVCLAREEAIFKNKI